MRTPRGGWILLLATPIIGLCGCERAATQSAAVAPPASTAALTAHGTQPPAAATVTSASFSTETIQHADALNELLRRSDLTPGTSPDKGAPAPAPTIAHQEPVSVSSDAFWKRSARAPLNPAAERAIPVSDQDPLPAAFPLTLDQAIATSLDRNPTLVALRATQPVADAVCRVAHTYPFNPLVQLEVIPLDREPDGRQAAIKHYVYFLQTLEFAHQQRYREAGGEAGRIQVGWNVVAAELTAAAQAERLYFTALYQRDLRDLARLTASQNEELLRVIQDRSNAGSAKATELPTAEVAARQSRKQAALAEANFQTAVQALKRQLNVDGGEPIDLVGRLEDFNWLPTEGVEGASDPLAGPIRISSEVTAQLASERPDVLAAQAGASMAQANADLARANMVQNVQIGPYYERDELGTIFLGFRLQTNIPVWDTGRPLANQREAETVAQSVNLQQLRERAQVEAQTAIERYERARRLVARERADALKSIPEQLEQARRQFNANRVDVLYLFTLQNNLLQERRTYLDLLNELAQAAADVTLTAGLPPARIVSGRIPANPLPPDAPPAQ